MSKVRINILAREMEVKSQQILDILAELGLDSGKTHSSSLEEHEADQVRAQFERESRPASQPSAQPSRASQVIAPKIDLSHISKPGDVLKAVLAKKQEEEAEARRAHAPARPPAAPPVLPPRPGPRAAPRRRPPRQPVRSRARLFPSPAQRRLLLSRLRRRPQLPLVRRLARWSPKLPQARSRAAPGSRRYAACRGRSGQAARGPARLPDPPRGSFPPRRATGRAPGSACIRRHPGGRGCRGSRCGSHNRLRRRVCGL